MLEAGQGQLRQRGAQARPFARVERVVATNADQQVAASPQASGDRLLRGVPVSVARAFTQDPRRNHQRLHPGAFAQASGLSPGDAREAADQRQDRAALRGRQRLRRTALEQAWCSQRTSQAARADPECGDVELRRGRGERRQVLLRLSIADYRPHTFARQSGDG